VSQTSAERQASPADELILSVGGMHCASCVGRVEKAIRAVPGVAAAAVNLASGRAFVSLAGANADGVARAIREAGFEAEPLNDTPEFVLATAVLFGPGLRFFQKGWPALRRRSPDMNSLVMIGTSAAYGYSVVATFVPWLLPAGTCTSTTRRRPSSSR
jgi:P-type Cu+ transporter